MIKAIDTEIAKGNICKSTDVVKDVGVDVWVNGTKYRRVSKSDSYRQHYYGEEGYRFAQLDVDGCTFIEDGVVLETEIEDGKGGKITYDVNTNTLTVSYYEFTKIGRWDSFIYTAGLSDHQTFRIVLEGNSIVIRMDYDDVSQMNRLHEKLMLGDDVSVVDDDGVALNACRYDAWDAKYIVFSKEAPTGTHLKYERLVSKSVNFISAKK